MTRFAFVTWVTSATEALHSLGEAVAAGDPFDVAIVDLQMPGVDGLELGRRIRASPVDTHLILLTSSAHRVHGRMAKSAGYETSPALRNWLRTSSMAGPFGRVAAAGL